MSYRSIKVSISITLIVAALGVWFARPYYLLWRAERGLNQLYRQRRPFAYRWIAAPYSETGISRNLRESLQNRFEGTILETRQRVLSAERILGRNARTLQLLGRIELLIGAYGLESPACNKSPECAPYNVAVNDYNLALLLKPTDPTLQLELGIAYALRAEAEARDLDYEPALEHVLQSLRNRRTPEAAFDSALLMENTWLILQANNMWNAALQFEPDRTWKKEAERRHAKVAQVINNRERHMEDLTVSPASYLAHATEAEGSIELVVGKALESWLPLATSPGLEQQAVEKLAQDLKERHHDPWFSDLLQTPRSPQARTAFMALSAAWTANSRGDHEYAEKEAENARDLFESLGNESGKLRSTLELAYSYQRRAIAGKCLAEINKVRGHAGKYVWMAGQAELDNITCKTQTREADVISDREKALQQITPSGYEGLRLRALGFLSENCVCFGSRLRIWQRGRQGAVAFWNQYLPAIRGFAFYANMGYSAHSAGDRETAVALMRETAYLLQSSNNWRLRARFLTELATWEMEAGLNPDALQHFKEASTLFEKADGTKMESYRREAEILHAEAEIAVGDARAALARLQRLTENTVFPYRELPNTERKRLLPAMGNALLALNQLHSAFRYFDEVVNQTREDLRFVQDCAQRDNAQREIESAWRGLAEINLRNGKPERAVADWESFRSGRLGDPSRTPIHTVAGTSLLVYAFLPSGLSAWLIDEHGLRAQHHIDGKQARLEAARFSGLAGDPDSPAESVNSSAKALYGLLISPFADELPRSKFLVIDADGPLAGIPWAALKNSHGTALVEQYALSQAAGWAEVTRQADEKTVDVEKAVILGEPVLGAELANTYPPLPSAQKEIDYLKGVLPQPRILEGRDATLGQVEELMPKATLFHFAGHGISYGGFGALVLAPAPGDDIPAQLMTSDKISNLDMHGMQLAVLSACSSGAGEQSGMVNLDSLVRGFLNAGAARVVAARWNVHSGAASEIMKMFYRAVLEKKQPAEALREAVLQVRKNPSLEHPYYWASFQVFGKP